ncbi:hypothetical protein LUZ60_005327 [Juncus effusus]|nr:hypothetical protein LUZ60_005327 [Juncus effusus]
MLDVNLFRAEKDRVRESLRRRYASVDLVDKITRLDEEWCQRQFDLDALNNELNNINNRLIMLRLDATEVINSANDVTRQNEENEKEVQAAKRSELDATEVINSAIDVKRRKEEKEKEVEAAKSLLYSTLETIGNLVHDSVPVSDDEAKNAVIRTVGVRRMEKGLKSHVDLVTLLDIVNLEKGSDVAGSRGYYLKGDGVLLNRALINFGLASLTSRGYTLMQTPFFMRNAIMGKCAQLTQFDEELYKVTGMEDEKYLIATAEQPLCAYQFGERIDPTDLPIRYAGFSTCFRKEVGSHGRDTLGIFRVHQFEKIEQFCITSPNDNDSWDMHEEMLKNSEDFYKELGLPYQVVAVVSGALNDAAAKKYDLEAWFPASETYRELVSCSNCTDYQSRKLGTVFGQKKDNEQEEQFVHMLNSTLTATERTICCILENYQREDGVEIPKVLVPFMGGKTFIPFKKVPIKETKSASKKKSK